MKTALIAAGIALISLTAPSVALAQPVALESSIIVDGKFQKEWQRGSVLEAKGLKALEESRKDLVKYSAGVVDAQTQRDIASQRATNARQTFESLTMSGAPSGTSKDALHWAKDLEDAASDWEKFEDRGSDGSKALEKAIKRQSKAQASVDKAQAEVDLGRKLKANASLMSAAES